MKFRLDRKTPFSRDAVFAWWTDFREDNHGHPGSPADSTRTILGRTGSEVWLRDRATRPIQVTFDEGMVLYARPGHALARPYPASIHQYAYLSDTADDSTSTRLDLHVRPRHMA